MTVPKAALEVLAWLSLACMAGIDVFALWEVESVWKPWQVYGMGGVYLEGGEEDYEGIGWHRDWLIWGFPVLMRYDLKVSGVTNRSWGGLTDSFDIEHVAEIWQIFIILYIYAILTQTWIDEGPAFLKEELLPYAYGWGQALWNREVSVDFFCKADS